MAATLTADQELTYFSFPIEKSEETGAVNPVDGTPDLMVYGKATDGTVDGDLQIVDPQWSAKALREWFDTGGNLRVQHQAQRDPAGKGIDIDITPEGHWVKALVSEPTAKHLVRTQALTCFSVGISRPDIRYGRNPRLDPQGKAIGGIITGRPDGTSSIPEVSLVDRGSNFNSKFQLVKAAADGSCEWVGKMVGEGDVLTKDAAPDVAKGTTSLEIPNDVSMSFSPADLAKLLEHRRVAEERQKDAEPDAIKVLIAAENAVYKRDIDTATRRRLAGEGRALSNLSYPIETHGDADNAVTLALSGHGNVGEAKALIRRIARKEGWQDILDRLDGKQSEKAEGAPEAAGPDVTKDDGGDSSTPVLHHDDGDDDDTDSDADTMDKAAAPEPPAKAPKVTCPNCGKKAKASAKFCQKCGKPMNAEKASKPTPADGVTGHDAEPVPEHREPDGPAIEALEHGASLPTDRDSQMKTALRHQALGVPSHLGALHDLACPAFDPAEVAKAHPHAYFGMIDLGEWQGKALEMAATAPIDDARKAALVWQHAIALKTAPAPLLDDIRAVVHKAFRDANPGPGSAPTPSEMPPAQRFNRPYITAGHAAPSPGQDAPHKAPISPGHISASDFQRGYISAGHAADSPGNGPRKEPNPAPEVPGVPSAVSYTAIQRDNAAQAMSAMHDHLAQSFPDLCPMYAPGHVGQQPSQSRPVPVGVGGPAAHSAGKTAFAVGGIVTPSDVTASGEDVKTLRRRLEKAVLKGEISVNAAREQLGLAPFPAPEFAAKAAYGAAQPDLIKSAVASAVAEAVAPLAAELTESRDLLSKQAKALKRQAETLDAIASQPDPSVAAYKGAALIKQASAPPAGALTVSKRAEQAQDATIRALFEQWRNSPDPEQRDVAWNALKTFHGLNLNTIQT